ncbi:MAG TPA: NTP pyrophosphohydrolase [Planctomycetaceae bacterium]|nr:NTP pyrophosphohydrolase [Planctomycetaceae bacterium]
MPGSQKTDKQTTVADLRDVVAEFVDERNWKCYHNAKNLSMALSIEAGELMEHFQWLTSEQVVAGEGYQLSEVKEELADVVCYALAIADALEIDLATAISAKMEKNRSKYPPAEGDGPASVAK